MLKFPSHLGYFASGPAARHTAPAGTRGGAANRPSPKAVPTSRPATPVRARVRTKPLRFAPGMFAHLRSDAPRSSGPKPGAPRHDLAWGFATEIERVAAARDGRASCPLIAGPRQETRRVSGNDIIAAARRVHEREPG